MVELNEPQRPLLSVGQVKVARRHNRESLKAYGNAVVPDVVEVIAMTILALEDAAVFESVGE